MNQETDAASTDLKSGPFSVLYNAVRSNSQVLVNVRNNHKLLGRVKAYDRHMNLYVPNPLHGLHQRPAIALELTH